MKIKFPVYAVILKTRCNPITQSWESRLRKNYHFGKETYPVWVYNLNSCVTKIGYDVTDYCGKSDIYMINNKTELNNFWSFCERLQKKNPGWFVHLGLLPSEDACCPFGGKCGKYENSWDNLEEAIECNNDYDNPESDFPTGTGCVYNY